MSGPATAMTSPAVLRALTGWLPRQRWFDGTGRPLASVSVVSSHLFAAPSGPGTPAGAFVVVRATDTSGADAGNHLLTLGAEEGARTRAETALIATDGRLVVYDALDDPRLVNSLVRHSAEERDLDGVTFSSEPPGFAAPQTLLPVRPLGAEQSNSSVVIDQRFILKILRRVSPGPSPDLVLHRLLRDAGSTRVTPLLAAVEEVATGATFATLQEFLPTAEDGWAAALSAAGSLPAGEEPHRGTAAGDFTAEAFDLGEAVAAVHRDLAASAGHTVLGREDYRHLSRQFLRRLERALAIAPSLGAHAERLESVFAAVADLEPAEHRCAHLTHGDLHLGQTLRTADGWLVLDFEGEPLAAHAERHRRHSPLRDVAGMLRSFDYAAHHRLTGPPASAAQRARAWHWATHSQNAFLAGYAAAGGQGSSADQPLLRAYELDKAVYEVLYDTRHRPPWAWIPLQAIARSLPAGVQPSGIQ